MVALREISSVVKSEPMARPKLWNNLRITYSNQANETVTHCFWGYLTRTINCAGVGQRKRDSAIERAVSSRTRFIYRSHSAAAHAKVEKLIANDRFLAYFTDASCDDVYLRESLGVNANY